MYPTLSSVAISARRRSAVQSRVPGAMVVVAGMGARFSRLEAGGQAQVCPSQVVDTDGGVDQNHARDDRRRGTARALGSLPPSRARRRALSRAIRARSPSWIRAVRSSSPDSLRAWARRASSRFSVVRTGEPSMRVCMEGISSDACRGRLDIRTRWAAGGLAPERGNAMESRLGHPLSVGAELCSAPRWPRIGVG